MTSLKTLYSELLIFRKHLPTGKVSTQYVDEYNALLTAAQEKTEIDLSRFLIRPTDLRRTSLGAVSNYRTGETRVSYSSPFCEHNFFMLRLDSAISHIADELGLDDPLTE